MNELKELINQLETSNGNEVFILQKINELFLTKLMISIKDDLVLYPTEVEAYYNHAKSFPDPCVHMNELQKNRFGKLYFHRKGKKKENAILFWNYGGIDVCISTSDDYYLSILIRSARINLKENPISGPCKLLWEVANWVCNEDNIQKLSEENTATLNQLEEKVVLAADNNDKRRINSISVTKRIGIHNGNYVEAPLRSVIGK